MKFPVRAGRIYGILKFEARVVGDMFGLVRCVRAVSLVGTLRRTPEPNAEVSMPGPWRGSEVFFCRACGVGCRVGIHD